MAKPKPRFVTPSTVNRTLATPRRAKNAELQTREYLTADEVKWLIVAAGEYRHGHRDSNMILIRYRHGLRAAEVCDLHWDQVDFPASSLHVRRVKQGSPSVHPLRGDELRALPRLQRESQASPFVFVSERGTSSTTAGFARMIERAGLSAGDKIGAHAHMLRHASDYALANAGHDTRSL